MRSRYLTRLVLLAACENATGPAASYSDISGTYSGVMIGTSQGVSLDATFSLTIAQSGGSLSGTDAVSGMLAGSIPVSGAGTFSGTIASGDNASVNITETGADCPIAKQFLRRI